MAPENVGGVTRCTAPHVGQAWKWPILMADGRFSRACSWTLNPAIQMARVVGLHHREGLGFPKCFFSPNFPTFGAFGACWADVAMCMGLAETARGHSKASPYGLCDYILPVFLKSWLQLGGTVCQAYCQGQQPCHLVSPSSPLPPVRRQIGTLYNGAICDCVYIALAL